MELPNLSKAMDVAYLRYIQSIHEPLERRNPDTLVRRFIPMLKRWRTAWLGRKELSRLRTDPFYYYLIARTKHYDQALNEAVSDGVRQIALIGCGTDTRAYRYEQLFRSKGVRVLECDQSDAILAKERMAKRWHRCDYVDYLPLDLNDDVWPQLQSWLGNHTAPKTLVLMEGVSVYVNDSAFSRFLLLLSTTLATGSYIFYDFKVRGVNDDLGRAGRTKKPFRLSQVRDEVAAFHSEHGLQLEHMESSSELSMSLVSGLKDSPVALFGEDVLVKLRPGNSSLGK